MGEPRNERTACFLLRASPSFARFTRYPLLIAAPQVRHPLQQQQQFARGGSSNLLGVSPSAVSPNGVPPPSVSFPPPPPPPPSVPTVPLSSSFESIFLQPQTNRAGKGMSFDRLDEGKIDMVQIEVRLDKERCDSKRIMPPSYITNNLPLVASLLASPIVQTPFAICFAHQS